MDHILLFLLALALLPWTTGGKATRAVVITGQNQLAAMIPGEGARRRAIWPASRLMNFDDLNR